MFLGIFVPVLFALLLSNISFCQFPPADDYYLEKFLNETMKNYTSFLQDGPIDPMPDVQLLAINEDGVDIDVELTNHLITGYELTSSDSSDAISIFRERILSVTRFVTNEPVTFSGSYKATGWLKADENLNISFTGEGTWTLKTVAFNETLTYVNYSMIGNEYIRLSRAEMVVWDFSATWEQFDLSGITFNTTGDHDPSWGQRVSKVWLKLYEKFLKRDIEENNQVIPPRALLDAFLIIEVTSTKLSDIIPGYGATTTTSRTTTPLNSRGKCHNIFNSWFVLILSLVPFLVKCN